jgi:hypothetical protein
MWLRNTKLSNVTNVQGLQNWMHLAIKKVMAMKKLFGFVVIAGD